MSVIRPHWRLRGTGCGLLAFVWLAVAAGLAQPTTSPSGDGLPGAIHLAADENTLWLVQSLSNVSRIHRRGVTAPFKLLEPLGAPIVSMAATSDGLYVFTDDGAFYLLGHDGWQCQLDLPGRQPDRVQPLDMLGTSTNVYVLIPSPPPGRFPRLVGGERPTTSQPFDAGSAPLSVARYDSRGWIAVAPAPDRATKDGQLVPRLGLIRERLALAWYAADSQTIECAQFDPETSTWSNAGAISVIGAPSGFWIVTISRVPAIVLAARTADGAEELGISRLLGDSETGRAEWRPAALRLSDLPGGAEVAHCRAACGFNQHVVLLLNDRLGRPFLRFGRIDASPTEATLPIAEVFAGHLQPDQALRWIHSVTLVVLFAVLLALFIFRRSAMVATVGLPADCAPALTIQRLVGAMIDLVPFLLAVAAMLGTDWRSGARELVGWAPAGDPAGRLPSVHALTWWTIGCAASTLYGLLMELFTQRTVGKMVMGTRVMSEQGTPASAWSILARNAFRFLELMPPFWLLGFLVVLSRNRQRLGDIFARTLVVRRVRHSEAS